MENMKRYAIIKDKNPREIVLLKGTGCKWQKCLFCDYYQDSSKNKDENFAINKVAIDQINGAFKNLEVINSGSYFELDDKTKDYLLAKCEQKGIEIIHIEAHWMYKNKILELKKLFYEKKINLIVKLGVETFDCDFRDNFLNKGMNFAKPEEMGKFFNEANFLFGLNGQTFESMKKDVEIGLKIFDRICINLMIENTSQIKQDKKVIEIFMKDIYEKIKDNPKIDILLNNNDFGVGEIDA